jgi:hypothetical protein
VADENPSGGQVATEWPLEGYFVVGGSGLYVSTECLGRVFTSRTTNHDLTIGLPQLDTAQQPVRVIPPAWTYGPRDQEEEANERDVIPWGAAFGYGAKKVYPPEARDTAVVYRCRYYTTLTTSNDEEFVAAADDFLRELDDWWTRFTSWVGILASQDFVRLGSYGTGGIKTRPLSMWTINADGQRAGRDIRSYFPANREQFFVLELHELEECITATGNQEPPGEWSFIRDARSLLNAGEYRRAVIDACTAAELSVTALIDRKFDLAGTSQSDRDQEFKDHHGLSKLIELHNKFRTGKVPKRLYEDVGAPRNKAAHDGATLSEAEARAAILKATEAVELAYPLASFLPIQTS